MKITETTTLAELELERMRLGITATLVTLETVDGAPVVEAMTVSGDGVTRFTGATMAIALSGAFELRERAMAERIAPIPTRRVP